MDNVKKEQSLSKQEYVQIIENIINTKGISTEDLNTKLNLVFPQKTTLKFKDISFQELQSGVNALIESFWDFIKVEDSRLYVEGLPKSTEYVDINYRNMCEVISRTYKRKQYYIYFHNISNVSELKEVALNSFWIIKLKPLTILKNDSPLRQSVNEKFALNLILSVIRYLAIKKGKKFYMPDKHFIQDTLYTFKYRDLSKEAMILFVDCLANKYGITIDSWI